MFMKNVLRNSRRAFVVILCALCFAGLSFAEDLYPQKKFFELAFSVDAGVSNNSYPIFDFLKKDLTLDLKGLAKKIPSRGLMVNGHVESPLFAMNINARNGFHLGIVVGVDAFGLTRIDKSLVAALGNGFNGGAGGGGTGYADAFVYAGIDVSVKLKNELRLTFEPKIFVPVLHANLKNLTAGFSNSRGRITAQLKGQASVYTSLLDIGGDSVQFDFAEIVRSMGFDLGFAAEAPLKYDPRVQIGGYIRIPIYPGTLLHHQIFDFDVDFDADLTNAFTGNGFSPTSNNKNKTSGGAVKYRISRPFKIGAEIAWRPFGSWFTFRALLGLGLRYPYTHDIVAYPDFRVSVSVVGINTFGAKLTTGYMNQVFFHELDFMIDARVIELHFAASAQSADFLKSFTGAGFGAKAYFSLGVPMWKKREKKVKTVKESKYIVVPELTHEMSPKTVEKTSTSETSTSTSASIDEDDADIMQGIS